MPLTTAAGSNTIGTAVEVLAPQPCAAHEVEEWRGKGWRSGEGGGGGAGREGVEERGGRGWRSGEGGGVARDVLAVRSAVIRGSRARGRHSRENGVMDEVDLPRKDTRPLLPPLSNHLMWALLTQANANAICLPLDFYLILYIQNLASATLFEFVQVGLVAMLAIKRLAGVAP